MKLEERESGEGMECPGSGVDRAVDMDGGDFKKKLEEIYTLNDAKGEKS